MTQARIQRAQPQSRKEAFSRFSAARGTEITKEAIRLYLDSFFNTEGLNRTISEVVSPGTLQYITDKSFDPTSDLTQRRLLLAKMFQGVEAGMPAILIIDAGFNPKPELQGLGGIQSTRLTINGDWEACYPVVAGIPITISVGAKDDGVVNHLGDFINLALGALKQLATGSVIKSHVEGESWEVRLPLTYSGSGAAAQTITEDPVDSIYARTFDLEPEFEDLIWLARDNQVTLGEESPRNIYVNEDNMNAELLPIISCPSEIQVNARTTFTIQRMRMQYRVVIDDYRIALVDPSSYVLIPRSLGTFNLQVLDEKSELVTEQAVTVIP
jgi:hypothetical protein